jgi:hypothetical protein
MAVALDLEEAGHAAELLVSGGDVGPERRAAAGEQRADARGPEAFGAALLAPGPEAAGEVVQRMFLRDADGGEDLVRDGRTARGGLARRDLRAADLEGASARPRASAARAADCGGDDRGGTFRGEERELLLHRLERPMGRPNCLRVLA